MLRIIIVTKANLDLILRQIFPLTILEGSYSSFTWTPFNSPNGLTAELSTDPNDPSGTFIINDLAESHQYTANDQSFSGAKILSGGEIVNADGSAIYWPKTNGVTTNEYTYGPLAK